MRCATGAAQFGQNFIGRILVALVPAAKGAADPGRGPYTRRCRPGWRNWQTQWTQNPPDRKILAGSTPAPGTTAPARPAATFFAAGASKRPMSRITEIELPASLVAAAQSGDTAALEAVYDATAGAIHSLLRRLVRRPAIAEELLQETFVDVLEHIGAFENRCPLPAWIRAIA